MRPDPLLVLTLIGLLAAGALAALNPTETYDPALGVTQAGRIVSFTIEVRVADHGDAWTRGQAVALSAPGRSVPWVWFRPAEERAQPGDLLVGHGLVERRDGGTGLVLSGPSAAKIIPGPHPLPVRWTDLAAHPEHFTDRLLVVNGWLEEERLNDPTGRHHCTVSIVADAATDDDATTGRWFIRLHRDTNGLGWHCSVEGPAP